ncbi:uncharacterized protein LOC134534070 isoform X2 [Bacillus rossius redtenbacheri]|uniref:uncharacterized protein LOC134534070 isoform X2 n=1 Tax=Bacillus rossius redtenbacheri TaxID=93214 RepID=UPI002FDE673D
MWNLRWWNRIMRRHTRPISAEKAVNWKQRLSLIYAFISFNAFGVVVYMMGTGRRDLAEYQGLKSEEEMKLTPGQLWAKNLNIQNATVFRMSGLRKTAEFAIREGEVVDASAEEQPEQ